MSWFCMGLSTFWRLGLGSVAHVAAYRMACRFGIYRQWLPVERWQGAGEFYSPSLIAPPPPESVRGEAILECANRLLDGELIYFSAHQRKIGAPPDWLKDPFSNERFSCDDHWSSLDEFKNGDIKIVWEASRFEWVPLLARAWRISGDRHYLEVTNHWLNDWVEHNPCNAGPNWKCGQEVSIRIVNMLLAAWLLDTHRQPSPDLVHLISIHCARIPPTIRYAVAQNNNHGISEAAALFIGGAWLTRVARSTFLRKKAKKWCDTGRFWLEDRVQTLVEKDGSFSQYSVNYHRVLVDTLCQVELWRRELAEPCFSELFTIRCKSAVEWLRTMTDDTTGQAPNVGANDGARLYDLADASYCDFRPSVQLSSVLFNGERAYSEGAWDVPLAWFSLDAPHRDCSVRNTSYILNCGGYLFLHGDHSRALVRFARFRFRPSHADCLHLDLWHRGDNILRDGGTYSYNTEARWLEYFSGTEAHNTVQFDGRSQMPRIGRFLFGQWLTMDECGDIRENESCRSWCGAYRDWRGTRHRRMVCVSGDTWRIIDQIEGFRDKAVLRWRLIPLEWTLCGTTCESSRACLSVSTNAPLQRVELTTGWESLSYLQKTELPVLEVEIAPGKWTMETIITLKD